MLPGDGFKRAKTARGEWNGFGREDQPGPGDRIGPGADRQADSKKECADFRALGRALELARVFFLADRALFLAVCLVNKLPLVTYPLGCELWDETIVPIHH